MNFNTTSRQTAMLVSKILSLTITIFFSLLSTFLIFSGYAMLLFTAYTLKNSCCDVAILQSAFLAAYSFPLLMYLGVGIPQFVTGLWAEYQRVRNGDTLLSVSAAIMAASLCSIAILAIGSPDKINKEYITILAAALMYFLLSTISTTLCCIIINISIFFLRKTVFKIFHIH